MLKNCYKWVWIDVLPEFYKNKHLEDIYDLRNSGNPLALVTRWTTNSEITLVNLISPVDKIFWLIANHHGYLAEITGIHAFQDGLNKNNSIDENMGNITLHFKKSLLSGLKKSSIKIDSPDAIWFEGFYDAVLIGEKIRKNIVPGDENDFHRCRVFSFLLPTENFSKFKEYLERELYQLNEFAFLLLDERHKNLGDRKIDCSEIDFLFRHIFGSTVSDFGILGFNAKKYPEVNSIFKKYYEFCLGKINYWIDFLENGGNFCNFSDSISLISNVVLFSSPIPSEDDRELIEKIMSCRARFIRLLGWPLHYIFVKKIIDPDKDDAFSNFTVNTNINISSLDVKHPYNLKEELKLYLIEMEEKYPIVRQWIS